MRKSLKQTNKERYEQRKQKHQCVKCGETDKRTQKGLVHCEKCVKQQSIYIKNYLNTEKGKQSMHRANIKCYQKKKSLGVCVTCGGPIEESRKGKSHCVFCAAKRAEQRKLTPQDKSLATLLGLIYEKGVEQ